MKHADSCIEIDSLRYTYPQTGVEVLKGLSLSIPQAKRVALLGPNGSGKSTTFKILSTQLSSWSGSITVQSLDLKNERQKVRSLLGVCFQSASLDKILTARENLFLQGRVIGLSEGDILQEIDDLAKALQVSYLDRPVSQLSGGQARRIEIMKALMGGAQVLLLDEATTGLDLQSRKDLWNELISINKKRGVTVIVTTHLIEEAENCDYLIFMSEGRCVAQGYLSELKASLGYEVVELEFKRDLQSLEQNSEFDSSEYIKALKPKLSSQDKIIEQNGVLRIQTRDSEKLIQMAKDLWGSELKRYQWAKPSLSDLYFDLTGKDL